MSGVNIINNFGNLSIEGGRQKKEDKIKKEGKPPPQTDKNKIKKEGKPPPQKDMSGQQSHFRVTLLAIATGTEIKLNGAQDGRPLAEAAAGARILWQGVTNMTVDAFKNALLNAVRGASTANTPAPSIRGTAGMLDRMMAIAEIKRAEGADRARIAVNGATSTITCSSFVQLQMAVVALAGAVQAHRA